MIFTVKERDEFDPRCSRCGKPDVEIEWCDVSTLGGAERYALGQVSCRTVGCYAKDGSRRTALLEPGGLTLEDHAWLNRMRIAGE